MDLLDLEKLNTLVSEFKPNCVIHLAAQAGVRIPLKNYFMYTNSNINGFNNILSCILENNIENFLYASSSSVYGNSSSIPFSESSLSLVPESFYGITKLSNELLASIHTRNSKLKSRGLRLFTVYGPWGRPDMAYFKLFSAAFNQSTFNLYGDGSVQRDFTYIDDVTLIIEKLLLDLELKPHGFNDIVNIGGGRPLSLNYLIEEIKTITGKNIIINRLDHSNSDSLTTIASTEYLEKIVGFHNFVPLEVGLKKFEYWAADPLVQKSMKSWIDL
jgi:UDP-glucuronate 4-epimerase